jgi:hypothetical protein
VSLITIISAGLIFVMGGLLTYSKQGMFTPIVCWLTAAASQRYRLRMWQVIALIAFSVYSVRVLSPLSQVGRALVPDNASNSQRAALTYDLLTHPTRLRAEYLESNSVDYESGIRSTNYFDSPQGLLDRLTMMPMDDRLIAYTLQGHTVGNSRLGYYFLNWIPHFILKNKEQFAPPGAAAPGNYYGHEVGVLSADDYGTGISFSPTAEAFHMSEWFGVLLIAPFVWTILFTVTDLVCGDLRRSPFGLIAVVALAHVAPESLLGGLVYFIFFGNLAIIVTTVFCSYAAPIIGALFRGRVQQPEAMLAAGQPAARDRLPA